MRWPIRLQLLLPMLLVVIVAIIGTPAEPRLERARPDVPALTTRWAAPMHTSSSRKETPA